MNGARRGSRFIYLHERCRIEIGIKNTILASLARFYWAERGEYADCSFSTRCVHRRCLSVRVCLPNGYIVYREPLKDRSFARSTPFLALFSLSIVFFVRYTQRMKREKKDERADELRSSSWSINCLDGSPRRDNYARSTSLTVRYVEEKSSSDGCTNVCVM